VPRRRRDSSGDTNVDILTKVRSLETTLARRFDDAARKLTRSGGREPLEILHAIVDAVEREIRPSGRGKHAFPFNAIHVAVLAPSRESRERLQAVLAGESGLRQRIDDKLRAMGCNGADVAVTVSYAGRAQPVWRNPEFHLRFLKVDAPAPVVAATPPSCPRVDLVVSSGVAEKRSYSFVAERIDLGRCAEVRDSRGRLVRLNNVAFVDATSGPNQSVSRRHAHIARPRNSMELRLYDDDSAHGTHIVRQGRTIDVPKGARGVRLNSGDEIALGDARLRIRIT
jgi:hypothetical protein